MSAALGMTLTTEEFGGVSYRTSKVSSGFQPGREADAATVAQLSGRIVSLARADDAGRLSIEVADGTRLVATPDCAFEAWTFAGPDGLKVVCGPGGELSVWSSHLLASRRRA